MLDGILDLLFPPKCPFCGGILDHPGICKTCRPNLPWTSEGNSLKTLDSGLICAAPLRYEGTVRDALHGLKFHGRASSAAPLGTLVAECAGKHFAGRFDTVTWTPVSRRRLRERGYDQAELLARSACCRWGTKPVRLVWKTKNNPAQSGLESAAQRQVNVQGVYKASGKARGRKILLIDDICTTGATLSSCAQALLDAGAERVLCASVALTGKSVEFGEE